MAGKVWWLERQEQLSVWQWHLTAHLGWSGSKELEMEAEVSIPLKVFSSSLHLLGRFRVPKPLWCHKTVPSSGDQVFQYIILWGTVYIQVIKAFKDLFFMWMLACLHLSLCVCAHMCTCMWMPEEVRRGCWSWDCMHTVERCLL